MQPFLGITIFKDRHAIISDTLYSILLEPFPFLTISMFNQWNCHQQGNRLAMLRPWNLQLQLNKGSDQAIYLQIAQKIIEEIQSGRLPPSSAMPGTRDLAEILQVNRKTIVLAYEELIAQGWLVTEKRRGTFVAASLSGLSDFKGYPHAHKEHPESLPSPTIKIGIPENQVKQNPFIDFTEGCSDNRLVPLETFSRAFRKALLLATRSSHRLNSPKGIPVLRASIATMLNMEKNFHIDAENICMVHSNQMTVFIIARLLTKAGDCVVFENLSNPAARDAFKSCGANILHVATDRSGVNVDEIARLASDHKIRAVYVTPQHQLPTTVTMSLERRKELLRLAELHDFYIIEDDCEHEFHFDEVPVFPLASLDKSERVIYLGSLSNVLSPGLQISYLVGPEALIDRCAQEKSLIDRQDNQSLEHTVSELMESGEIQRHSRRISKTYAERRQLMQRLVREELGTYADFDLPKGGLAFWLRFRQQVDMESFVKHGLEENVGFSQGAIFCGVKNNIQAIRLGFASLNEKELTAGIMRIKRALIASVLMLFCMISAPQLLSEGGMNLATLQLS